MTNDLEAFLAPHAEWIQDIVRKARHLVLERIPEAIETQDKDNLGFGYGTGYADLVCVIAPHKQHVTIGIYDAVALPDPEGLLEGTGKRHRHVKIRNEAELENPALWELVSAAVAAKHRR